MSQPGKRAKLESRTFIDLDPQEVLQRKAEVMKVRTLSGIMSKYHYVCQPDGEVGHKLVAFKQSFM